ncbi:chemotaxis protein CheW [Microvirga pudoricolor]|uniref:chemotaxis protein CheW n=1 Tax=Microvirga pudoricolor TaxID=2778729 RepID=UPI0019501435|nr:chemotaxis protein CheW [Microvirga pudoricolor]MBM6594802.1 chemotaxis protein CheW [Microvirga pudoricolor]
MAKAHRRKIKLIGRAAALSAEERLRLILEERTESLAARVHRAAADAPVERRRVVVCKAGRERIGVPVEAVEEVLPYRACVPAASAHPALIGHFGQAGRLVSVIDLGLALGIGSGETGQGGHYLLLRREQPRLALRVERAQDVVDAVPMAGQDISGQPISGPHTDAITGLARTDDDGPEREGVIALLDLDRLIKPFLTLSPASGA